MTANASFRTQREEAAINSFSIGALIAASADPMALLVETLAGVMTDEQWARTEPLVEDAVASYHQLFLANEERMD